MTSTKLRIGQSDLASPSTSGNVLTSNGTAWTSAAQDGWIPSTGTWSYSSADSPTFVISVNNDQTAIVGVGQRIKLTQATGGTKYFIVTAVGTYGAGVTLITVYGGTNYTLNNEAISTPYHSSIKAPFGFPVSPIIWTVEATQTVDAAKSSPAASTWYGDTGLSATGPNISLPIGAWLVNYQCTFYCGNVGTNARVFGSLSTAANSESDADFTAASEIDAVSGTLYTFAVVSKQKHLLIAAKTTYYLIVKTHLASALVIGIWGSVSKTIIRASCGYL